jgi:hypothetical protein
VNEDIPIPDDHRGLIACLRGALNDAPPDADLASADWPLLFRRAREQGVDTYLYPWLAARLPDVFSARNAPPDSVPAAWRARFLEALPRASLRRRQLAGILAAFERARLDVVPLKGAWLGETAYDDPALRTMSDLDLLIRPERREACHAVLLGLGYTARSDTLHTPFAYDQSYTHPAHRLPLELHWDVSSALERDTPVADTEAVWRQTVPGLCCGHAVRALPAEDQLAHLVHHMLHHLFAVPLRAYLDIALLLRKHGNALTPAALEAAGLRWRTGRAVPFALRLTGELLARPLPAALCGFAPPLDARRRDQALHALFNLPTARARSAETTLLRFRRASAAGRLRLVLSRVFMPRAFLAVRYPCARRPWGLPLAWFCRARDLRREHREKLKALLARDPAEARRLDTAAMRQELSRWLSS